MTGLKFKSNGDGTCQLVVTENFTEEILEIPEKSPHGDKVISLFLPATFNREVSFRLEELEEITVDPENTRYSSFEGVLFNKDMTTLIQCPPRKSGIFIVPSSVRKLVEIRSFYQVCSLDEVIFQEGIKFIGENTFYNMKIVTFPNSLEKISDEAFCWDWEPSWSTTIRAPKNSVAHCFAIEKGCRYMPTDCSITWNSKTWLEKFYADGADYHSLRREVWENTRAIVEDNGYSLLDGSSVLLTDAKKTNGEVQIVDFHTGKSRYYRRFRKSVDIAVGDYLVGLREDGKVVFAPGRHRINWYGGVAVAACEGHSAMLKANGTVLCVDHPNKSPSGYPPTPEYSRIVESWRNIKQIALTYEEPFALTRDGKFLCENDAINDFFNAYGKEIIQISAFGAYYINHLVASLYADGTVKACDVFCDSYEALDEIEFWNNVKKICCGHHVLIGLMNGGKILISSDFKHDCVETLENIIDIAEGGSFIALSRTGEIIL